MGAILREYRYRKAERDLRAFIEYAWPTVEPVVPYVPNWHIDAIADHLMAVTLGHVRRLKINIPPRNTKTRGVCTYWPAWEWIQWPHVTSIYTGIKLDNVLSESVDARRLMLSDWYQERWGDRFEFTGDQNTKGYYENDKGGARRSLSLLTDPVGKGADKVVCDDPNGLDDALNAEALDRAWAKWKSYRTRINDKQRGSFVLIQQRVHDLDVSGRLDAEAAQTGEDWVTLLLPAEFDPKRICVLSGTRARPIEPDHPQIETLAVESPWGAQREIRKRADGAVVPTTRYRLADFRDPREDEGEPLNPGREPAPVLRALAQSMGPWEYQPQYNQNPVPREGALFPRENWRFYRRPPMSADGKRVDFDEWMQSWDCAFKDLVTSDPVAGGTLGRKGPNVYVVEVDVKRRNITSTCQAVEAMTARWPRAVRKLVEDKANGPAVVDLLKGRLPGLFLVNPEGGKEARANATEPFATSGNLWLPDYKNGCEWPDGDGGWRPLDTSWVEPFMFELERFPKATHDDQVDMLTQAVVYWLEKLNKAKPTVDILALATGQPSLWKGPR